MFSQRKKFYEKKSFYALLAFCILAFGIWMNGVPINNLISKEATQGKLVNDYESKGDNNQGVNQQEYYDNEKSFEPTTVEENGVSMSESDYPCYFIQEQGGVVKVFYYNTSGQSQLVRTTAISYSLLSEGDQILFQKGIVKKTEDDLKELLQDFES